MSWKQGTWLIPHHKSCPLKKRHFWSLPSPLLYFFSQTMLMAQVTLPIFLQTCVFLTVWGVFFFKLWLALCEVDFCWLLLFWHIKLLFLTSMWVVIYPWLTNYCYSNYRPTWIQILACECFFFSLSSSIVFVVCCCFFISPCFYCLSCLKLIKLQTPKKCRTSHYSKSCDEMQYWRETEDS